MMQYFSDHELGEQPRTIGEISPTVWKAIAWLVQESVENGSFGQRFPERCEDYPFSNVCYGVDIAQFEAHIKVEIPVLAEMEQDWRDAENKETSEFYRASMRRLWEMSQIEQPPLPVIMDIIEFCWKSISRPIQRQGSYHSFFGHYHLSFDKDAGQAEFRESINHIFRRNGVAFELTEQGRIERLIPGPVGSALRSAVFQTGDTELNQLLETARCKIFVPDENEHRDALEKLWDAWERLKTIKDGDKKTGAAKMLDEAAGASQPMFRALLEAEATALTNAGNKLRIRHSETRQERLEVSEQVDYLFQRMYSLIHLILRASGRVG